MAKSTEDVQHVMKLKDAEGYLVWSFQINILFAAKGLTDIIEGSNKYSDAGTEQAKKIWKTNDARAKNYIVSTIDHCVIPHVLSCVTSKDMFDKLKTIFERDNEQVKCHLLQEFYAYSFNSNKTMMDNISAVKNLAFRLNQLKQNIDNTMIMTKIIGILPQKYSYFSSAWDSVPIVDRNLDNLCARLQAEEAKVSGASGGTTTVAFKTFMKHQKKNIICFKCHKKGHTQNVCRSNTQQNFSKPNQTTGGCSICKRVNHSEKDCYLKDKIPCVVCKKDNHAGKDCFFRNKSSQVQRKRTYDAGSSTDDKQPNSKKPRMHDERKVSLLSLHQKRAKDQDGDNVSKNETLQICIMQDSKSKNQMESDSKSKNQSKTNSENVGSKSSKNPSESKNKNQLESKNQMVSCKTQLNNQLNSKNQKEMQLSKNQSQSKNDSKNYSKSKSETHEIKVNNTCESKSKTDALVCSSKTAKNDLNYEFVVDSGATEHMTDNTKIMSKITLNEESIGVAKKNQSMYSKGIGTVKSDVCDLKVVHYVPELTRNLMSVNAITRNDGAVIFTDKGVQILKEAVKVPEELVVVDGPKQNGLFVVNLKPDSDSKTKALMTDTENSFSVWHRKMGHLGVTNLVKLSKLSTDVKLNVPDSFNCDICAYAKQVKQPYGTTREKADRLLKIIHSDVCGPIDPKTYDGKRYFVTFLDDYSHYCVVYLMTCKSELFGFMKKFICEAENLHCVPVHKIRCDNGGEYTSHAVKDWCNEKGIVLDYSVPRCPELNGKAERLNRTLEERVRALLIDSGLDPEMWGEAVQTAAYLVNRSPTTTNTKLPAEMWYSKFPDLSRIKLFGSKVFAKITTYCKKLDNRSQEAVFVGYTSNGYRLWDSLKRKIFISRDVIFTLNTVKKRNTLSSDQGVEVVHEAEDQADIQEDLEEMENQDNNPVNNEQGDEENQENEENPENAEERNAPVHYQLRDRRQIKTPARYQDFEVYLCGGPEALLTYQECSKDPDWSKAIQEEKDSLKKNDTWEIIDKEEAEGQERITSRWIFTVKDDGMLKARLVARGFQQDTSNWDIKELFSPVVDSANFRVIFALVAAHNLHFKTFDVKTAFLNGTLDTPVYMEIPEGFSYPNKVCLLKKALYGLKQAPLRWYKRLSSFLIEKGMYQLKCDRCMFKTEDGSLFLAIHVDDGFLAGKNIDEMNHLLEQLSEEFEVKVNHTPKSYLGMEIDANEKGLFISQSKYVKQVLRKYGFHKSSPVSTPMVPLSKNELDDQDNSDSDHKNSKSNKSSKNKSKKGKSSKEDSKTSVPDSDSDTDEDNVRDWPYRQVVGSLLYLSCKTRPDIAYAVNCASRAMENPDPDDIIKVKRILRYLKGTTTFGIQFSKNQEIKLESYSDSDFAGGKRKITKAKSTTGFVVFCAEGPVVWCSRKQSVVALSSAEAEYIAAAELCKQLQSLKFLLNELISKTVPISMGVDNQSAVSLIKKGQMGRRSKHIDVRYYYISELLDEKVFEIEHCPSDTNVADIFTKPLVLAKFSQFRDMMCFSKNM